MDELGGKLAMGVFLQDGTYKQQIKQDIALMSEFAGSARNASNILDSSFDDVTKTVVTGSGQMTSAIDGIGSAFTRLVSAGAAIGFVRQMFNVRSEMQDTESTLRTFLGSAEQASQFMKELQDAAYWNTFEFKDLAEQSAQMLAYGNAVESVIPTIDKLSNIASATSQPLERFVSIWNKVKVNDRLDSMTIMSLGSAGLDVKSALAEIESVRRGYQVLASEVDTTGLRFKDLEEIINHVTEEGGRFHGVMKEKMDNLGDSYGLLQDNLTNMFNEIGQASQGALKKGIDIASGLVENYKKVAAVLGTLVAAYGAVKAGNVAHNIAMKNGTGITVLDNTVNAIRAKLLKSEILLETDVVEAVKKRTAEQKKQLDELKQQVSQEQLADVINKQRVKNLEQILTQEQKQYLTQHNLTQDSKEYVAAAVEIMDKDQLMSFQKGELSNNTAAYITALQSEIEANKVAASTIDKRLGLARDELDVATELQSIYQDEVNSLKEQIEAADSAGDAEKSKALQTKLATAQTNLNTASNDVNTATEKVNTLEKEKNTIATNAERVATQKDTVATQTNTLAKRVWATAVGGVTKAFKLLKAAIASNPIGAALVAVMALVSALKKLIDKENEAKKAAEEAAEEERKYYHDVNVEEAKLDMVKTHIEKIIDAHGDEKDAVSKLNDEYGGIFGTYRTLAEWYDVLNSRAEQYIKKLYLQKKVEKDIEDIINLEDELKATQAKSTEDFEPDVFGEAWNAIKGGFLGGVTAIYDIVKNSTVAPLQAIYDVIAGTGKETQRFADIEADANAVAQFYYRQNLNTQQTTLDFIQHKIENAKQQAIRDQEELAKIEQEFNSPEGGENGTTVAEKKKKLRQEIAEIQKELANARKDSSQANKQQIEDLEKQLQERQKELKLYTDSGARDKAKKQAEELLKLTKELEIARQEAVIALMEEGAEKQQAILDLELAKQLKSIEDAKAEAKKKGVDFSEGSEADQSFKKQTEAAEKAHEEASLKVYDHEIEERKQRYEDYLEWRNAVGEAAADREFSDLITKGKSFKEWIDNEIARLEKKGANGGLSGGEQNYLNSLYLNNYGAGGDSSYRTKETEIGRMIDQAVTLEKKIEEAQAAIRDLENNGDNSVDKNALIVKLQKQIQEYQRQQVEEEKNLYKELIAEYGNYTDQRKKIDEQYAMENALLNKKLKETNDPAEKASIQRAIKQLEKQRDKALKDLSSAYLKSIFEKAFDPEATQETIKQTLDILAELDTDTYNPDWLKKYQLSKEDWEKVKGSIKGVKKELKERVNGGLLDQLKEIREAFKKGEIEKAMQGLQGVASVVSDTISSLADALSKLADVTGNENLAGIASNMEKTANVISSTVSGAAAGAQTSGSWIGALVGGLLGLGTSLMSAFGQSSAEIAAAQKQRQEEAVNAIYEGVQALYDNRDAMNSLESAITGLDYANIAKQLQSIIDSIEQNNLTAKQQLNFDNMTTAISSNVDNMLRMAQDLVNRGILDLHNLRTYDNGARSHDDTVLALDAVNYYLKPENNEFYNNVYRLEELFKELAGHRDTPMEDIEAADFERLISHNLAAAIINYLKSFQTRKNDIANELRDMQMNPENYTTMQMFGKMQEYRRAQKEELEFQLQYAEALGLTEEQVLKLRQQIDGLTLDIKEANVSMFEAFAGTDIAGIVEEWISIFDEFGNTGKLAFDKIDQSIDKMISNMIRQQAFIKPLTDKIKAMIEEAAGDDGILQDNELQGMFEGLRGLKGFARDLYENTMELERQAGLDLNNTSGNTFSAAVKGVSEETASIIAGQMNAIRVHQIEIQEILQNNIGENVAVIARNSAYLPQIYDRLGRVETAVNNSYSQRIGAQ